MNPVRCALEATGRVQAPWETCSWKEERGGSVKTKRAGPCLLGPFVPSSPAGAPEGSELGASGVTVLELPKEQRKPL